MFVWPCVDRKREVGGQRLGSGNDPAVDREGGKEKRVHGAMDHAQNAQSMFATMYRKYREDTNSGDSSTFSTFGTSAVCSKPHPTHIPRTQTTPTTPQEDPIIRERPQERLERAVSVHVSASLPSISGIYTYKGRASGASRASRTSRASMAGMTVRVGTCQHTNLPTRW